MSKLDKPRIYLKRYSSGLYWCVSARPVPYRWQSREARKRWGAAQRFVQDLNRKLRDA